MIDPLLIATLSVIGGAILNTFRGFLGSSDATYDIKKFFVLHMTSKNSLVH